MKELIEQLKNTLNFRTINERSVIFLYSGTADVKAILELPDGTEKEADHIQIAIYRAHGTESATYDSNVYGVEPQYAVGGYVGGGEVDYEDDPDCFELSDDEYEKWPEGTQLKKILHVYDEDVEVVDELPDDDGPEYEPDYDY